MKRSDERFYTRSTSGSSTLKFYLVTATLIIITLLISIIPFILFGEQLESWATQFFNQEWLSERPVFAGLLVIGLLTSDILLPVPSSAVCTIAGRMFGILTASLICWIGLNFSTAIGYLAGSRFGWPVARRLCSTDSLLTAEKNIQKWGIWPIVILRGFPVLAEASILIAGIYRFPAKLFWLPVMVANLGVVLAYVALGGISAHYGWFSLAVPISLGIPVAWLVMWMLIWKPKNRLTNPIIKNEPGEPGN